MGLNARNFVMSLALLCSLMFSACINPQYSPGQGAPQDAYYRGPVDQTAGQLACQPSPGQPGAVPPVTGAATSPICPTPPPPSAAPHSTGQLQILCTDVELASAFKDKGIICTLDFYKRVARKPTFDMETDLPEGQSLTGDVFTGTSCLTIKNLISRLKNNNAGESMADRLARIMNPNGIEAKADCIDPRNPNRGYKTQQIPFLLFCEGYRCESKFASNPQELLPALNECALPYRFNGVVYNGVPGVVYP